LPLLSSLFRERFPVIYLCASSILYKQCDSIKASEMFEEEQFILLLLNIVAKRKGTRIRASRQARESFVKNVALVLQGIRTAYLIDCIDLTLEFLEEFLLTLSSELNESHRGLARVLKDGQSQVYIINETLLKERMRTRKVNPWTQFCLISPESFEVCSLLSPLEDVLDVLENSLNSAPEKISITLAEFEPKTGVSLAGFLLEYPLSYYPLDSEIRSLDGISLRIFEATLIQDLTHGPTRSQQLMKFSIPVNLLEKLECILNVSVSEAVRRRFFPRISCTNWTNLVISESDTRLDVVVL